MYSTDDVIAETGSEITSFAQPSHMTLSQYAEKLVKNTLGCGDVYEDYAFNKIFIGGLDALIGYSMREYWEDKKEANLHDHVFYATSLLRLQEHDITSNKINLLPTK